MALKKKALAEQEAHKLARRDAAARRLTQSRVEGHMRARMDAADVAELEKVRARVRVSVSVRVRAS